MYESRINELIRENESLNEKYKRLENAKLSDIQEIIRKNALLTKQVIFLFMRLLITMNRTLY